MLQWVIGSTLILLLLVRCGAPPATPGVPTVTPTTTLVPLTDTPVPPTATPIPPTNTPEPTSCDEVEGDCLELSFDGEKCTYEGPSTLKPGAVTLLFLNESEERAAAGLMRLTGDKTIQDVIDYIGKNLRRELVPLG